MTKIKLNIGSNNKIIGEDYINIDILDLSNVDAICDLTKFPFALKIKNKEKFDNSDWNIKDYNNVIIPNNIIDEIIMEEVLEHISFKYSLNVLRELHRILKPNSKVHIQVPDCGKAMEYYVNKEICKCVPHKPKSIEDAKADSSCFQCGGKGKIHPNRWLYSFLGAQKHSYDSHKAIFNKDVLDEYLRTVGFNIEWIEDPLGWKLKCNCIK